ncbi:MAG TPA: DUF3800 domain-containing protein [Solirubrobacterales bacterium]|nr:DUF3800 domain-containing protein [Solirubrobacterales bacterium]
MPMLRVIDQGGVRAGRFLAEDHPTATIYLDESGVIKTDRFFGIGCLKVINGPELTRALRRKRQKLEFYDEIHWAGFDKARARGGKAFELALAALETFFDLDGVSFCCTVADRHNGDLAKSYGSSWSAYEGLSTTVLDASVGDSEVVSVMADHVDTPPHVRFEETVASELNRKRGRLAVTAVTRVHSHAVDGLQLADLLLGAAMFDFRQGATRGEPGQESQKAELSRYLLDRCGVVSFRPGGKSVLEGKVNVSMKKRKRVRRGRRGGDPT